MTKEVPAPLGERNLRDGQRMMEHFEALYGVLPRDLKSAGELESPNPEDSPEIKPAIVGFSYSAPTEQWARSHYEFVRRQLPGPDLLEHRERLFFALCLGFMLGLRQANKATDADLMLGCAQLPGYIASKGGKF